jgi:hypothetical protein
MSHICYNYELYLCKTLIICVKQLFAPIFYVKRLFFRHWLDIYLSF